MLSGTQAWESHARAKASAEVHDSEVPRCFNMNFSRMLLAVAAMVSLAYAYVHHYQTVDYLWVC